ERLGRGLRVELARQLQGEVEPEALRGGVDAALDPGGVADRAGDRRVALGDAVAERAETRREREHALLARAQRARPHAALEHRLHAVELRGGDENELLVSEHVDARRSRAPDLGLAIEAPYVRAEIHRAREPRARERLVEPEIGEAPR